MYEAIEEDYDTGLALAEELILECQRQDLSTGPALGAALAVIFKVLMDETPNQQAMMGVLAMAIGAALSVSSSEESLH
ncbi:MAG TPA: hypothetical protein DIS96_01980 [Pusillimonas sp.]|jgi:hypothetical protein|nr:hypothetical protein [Pusillimonas sp.]|tara:strand:+ start:799 stop:1032 length:234 start_codon:yes stop_codon:yes gene_type:complete